MNVEETIAIIECLKERGATYFKSKDFEVHLRKGVPLPKAAKRVAPPPSAKETQADFPLNAENTKRAEDLIKTLKLDPESLINTIFPDGAGG